MNDPDVVFVVVNLRMGGQVSAILSLIDILARNGVRARLLLPDGVSDTSKASLQAWAARPFLYRLAATLRLLRTVGRVVGPTTILHLVLPSPAMCAVARLVSLPSERIVLQYEAAPARFDGAHLRHFIEEPFLFAPRLLLNHRFWARLGRSLRSHHLATYGALAQDLGDLGLGPVETIANFSSIREGDLDETVPELGEGRWVGYIGHAHRVKGVEDLLRAFSRAACRRSDLRLFLALSADGRPDRIANMAMSSRFSERILVRRLVPVGAILRSLDALVLPYRSMMTTTMYPSLLLEAHGEHCPVVVSRVPELLPVLDERSRSLYTFAPCDIDALADTLTSIPPRNSVPFESFLRLPSESERIAALLAVYERARRNTGFASTSGAPRAPC